MPRAKYWQSIRAKKLLKVLLVSIAHQVQQGEQGESRDLVVSANISKQRLAPTSDIGCFFYFAATPVGWFEWTGQHHPSLTEEGYSIFI